MERVRGIEPLSAPWQGAVLPLYDTREMKRVKSHHSSINCERNEKNEHMVAKKEILASPMKREYSTKDLPAGLVQW
jgi:hypothetical protein